AGGGDRVRRPRRRRQGQGFRAAGEEGRGGSRLIGSPRLLPRAPRGALFYLSQCTFWSAPSLCSIASGRIPSRADSSTRAEGRNGGGVMLRAGMGVAFTLAAAMSTAAAQPAQDRGTYLMSSIVACGNCHTPQTPQGPVPGKELAGGTRF